MVYRGRVKNGVVVLDDPAALPEGAEVQVEPIENKTEKDLQNFREGLLKFAGSVSGLPKDMARNHDHYLYGTPPK